MLKVKSLLLTIFTTCCVVGYSQRQSLPVTSFTSRDYGKELNPEIYCAIQDPRGVMYFGTANGVQEFDGTKWQLIKVQAGSYVRSLAVDSSGTVFVGTYGEIGYIAPNNIGEMEYVSLLEKVPMDDQWFSDIWQIHCSKDKIYFQAQEQVMVYDLESESIEVIYPTETSSFHTSFLINGELYLRAREIGIVKLVNGDLERLHGTEMVRGLGVFGLHELSDDSLLIITQEIGIWKWSNGAARLLPEQNSVSTDELGIYGSAELNDGNFAVWTFNSGAYIIDETGLILNHFDKKSGLPTDDVKHIFQDRDQNVWLSLENGVAMINYYAPFSHYGEKSGITGNVVAVHRFKEKLYVGTSDGLLVQSESEGKIFENTDLVKLPVWDFCEVDDRLYIATSRGVVSTTNGTTLTRETPIELDANAIKFFPEKNIFIVSGPKGFIIYDRNFRQIYRQEENLSLTLGIEADKQHPDWIWLGTVSNGAYRIIYNDSISVEQYTDFDGLLDNIGKPLYYGDTLIFGSKEGVSVFMDEEEMKKGLTEEELADPLNWRGMFQVQDFHDYTTDGQFLFLKSGPERDWFSDDNYSVAYFDHANQEFIRKPFKGVDVGRINRFYLEDNGVLWVGGSDGLIASTGHEKNAYENEFYTLIRKFSIGEDSLVFNGTFDNAGKIQTDQSDHYVLEIAHDYNDVKFSFSSPYFEYGEAVEYSFILEGYDKHWTRWSKKTEANFTNLNEGDYIFKVKARNVYGDESAEAHFKFVVLPPWYRTTLAIVSYVIGMIILFFVGFRLFSLRLKRKNIWLEGVVEERTKEIREKNHILKEQKQEIEDSINYAQRIQEAILPLENEMKHHLPNSFVLFRPKDIVSGDFYWFKEVDGKLVFICADCTGHGVPGAFMSMIGSDRLQIIVEERKVLNPGKILSELNVAIKTSLKQDGQTGSTKDGMDAAICTIDLETKEMRYAGANRPLWIVENGELEEVKATKVAVAGFTPDEQIYEEHVIPLKAGVKYYMTSDGYADQFGGIKGKKLKVKTMKEFILNVCNKEFGTQRDELEKNLIDWMEGYEQIDDVCVVGFEPVH